MSAGSDLLLPADDAVTGLRSAAKPLARRRLAAFRANRRGFWSLWIFLALFGVSLGADLIANDKPLLIRFDGGWYSPLLKDYTEADFGGDFPADVDYRDAHVRDLIRAKGWMVWPPIPFSYRTINYELGRPAPAPPSPVNWLGTDDQARDVLARTIYGFRITVTFALISTVLSSLVGLAAGAVQGYLGGLTDLLMQRFVEMWSGLPVLFVLVVLASIVQPTFWWLLGFNLMFTWVALVPLVRSEFLRARNFDFVRAARALGATSSTIIVRHVLPNALIATLTYLPFIMSGAVATLTSLDFLGFGLPPGSASLGELLTQGKNNPQAPWLGLTGFIVTAVLLMLLIFIGEGVRDALDPRRSSKR